MHQCDQTFEPTETIFFQSMIQGSFMYIGCLPEEPLKEA